MNAADYGVGWAVWLFYSGIALAVVAQIIAYLTSPRRTWMRLVGTICGIAAVLLIGEAGQIVNTYLKAVANASMIISAPPKPGYKQSMEMLTAENFNYASAAVAMIAAVLWFRSACLRFPSSASATIAALGTATHINLTELSTALRRQGWWSAAAAGCSALAAMLMAIGTFLSGRG
jgi:hypothetical protein